MIILLSFLPGFQFILTLILTIVFGEQLYSSPFHSDEILLISLCSVFIAADFFFITGLKENVTPVFLPFDKEENVDFWGASFFLMNGREEEEEGPIDIHFSLFKTCSCLTALSLADTLFHAPH